MLLLNYLLATRAVIAIFVLLFIIASTIFSSRSYSKKRKQLAKSPSKSKHVETRKEAWENAIKETRSYLEKNPDRWSSDGVLPVRGWRELR